MSSRPGFFEVTVQDLGARPSITGLCAGFEADRWRSRELITRLFEDLPTWALAEDELAEFAGDTGMEMLARAVHNVYDTEKYDRRGEFGELLLHVVLTEVFHTVPAISKIYFKDAPNDTVKGFDAVHVVDPGNDELELWLGEVKFYDSVNRAVRDVVTELRSHLGDSYLRKEFAAIRGKLPHSWTHRQALLNLIDQRISLDHIFSRIVVPVLLTYDSPAVASRVTSSKAPVSDSSSQSLRARYVSEITDEIGAALLHFSHILPKTDVTVRLMLIPLESKKLLVEQLDRRFKALRTGLTDD